MHAIGAQTWIAGRSLGDGRIPGVMDSHEIKSGRSQLQLFTDHCPQNPCRTNSSTVSELSMGSLVIIFSTYLAIRSASRLTGSPGLSELRLVISTVCGMIAIVQIVPSSFATVRLIPS